MADDSTVPWKSPSSGGFARRRFRALAAALALGLVAALTLVATQVAPAPNGLGILPSVQTILERSGVTLQFPKGAAAIRKRQAVAAATQHQSQAQVERAFLATAVGAGGSPISPPGRLCWVVFLNPGSDALGNAAAPGQIQLDAVLVDAQTGAVIEGFISFRSTTPKSAVGTE